MSKTNRTNLVTNTNALGLQEWDLVKTAGKGICIVLRKKSLNDELVLYSMSSATETHPTDDDGMAKVRRYNADGTIATTSETTGKKLKNREIYTILGIASYANPVLAMKDFINQNENIDFDMLVEEDETTTETAIVSEETQEAAMSTLVPLFTQMVELLTEMNAKLDNI